MFPPDADVSPHQVNASELLSNGTLTEAPTIVHANTRLPEQSEGAEGSVAGSSVPPSPTRSRIAAAISGTSCEFNKNIFLFSGLIDRWLMTSDPLKNLPLISLRCSQHRLA